MANMVLTMGKALLKHKLHLGELNGMERFTVSAVTLADRSSTFLAANNVEPELVDPRFNHVLLSQSLEANLELFELVRQRIKADIVAVVCPGHRRRRLRKRRGPGGQPGAVTVVNGAGDLTGLEDL